MVGVTGANGLLGTFIVRKLIGEKIQVAPVVRKNSDLSSLDGCLAGIDIREADVTDSNTLLEALKDVDTVIHAAAVVSFDPRAKDKIYRTNVEGTRNLVNACLSLNIKRLIFVSSVAALGRKRGQTVINEESQWIESDLNSDYAKSKYLAELEVYRGQEEGLNISIVNPSVILAPANPLKSSGQIFNYVLQERSFYANGTINYVDVRDVADVVFKLMRGNLHGEKFIANAGDIALKELMDMIATRLDKKAPSIKIGLTLLNIAAWLEEMRSRIMGSETLFSRQTVKMQNEKFVYQNQKSVNQLQLAYRPLLETLDWCCDYYKKAFNSNNRNTQY